MNEVYNIYCDESCHLENDKQKSMVLGSLVIPKRLTSSISEEIKRIKTDHGVNAHTELKWKKVSANKSELYRSLISYFIQNPHIRFRCIVVPDKSVLDHTVYKRTHDDFYYVMFYYALRDLLCKNNRYHIYFDYKDNMQNQKLNRLRNILIKKTDVIPDNLLMQPIQSYESQLIQLADIVIGAVSYKNRDLSSNKTKVQLVSLLESEYGSLKYSSPRYDSKFNVFCWTGKNKVG